jgi:hypothetical protein
MRASPKSASAVPIAPSPHKTRTASEKYCTRKQQLATAPQQQTKTACSYTLQIESLAVMMTMTMMMTQMIPCSCTRQGRRPRSSLVPILVMLLVLCSSIVQAQFIDQVACLDCISQEGCQYCIAESGSSSSSASSGTNSTASPLYCECNVVEGMTCLTTEEQCEIDMAQMIRAALTLLLLPCLCACACLAGCIYLCCRSGGSTKMSSAGGGGNYYMQEGAAYHNNNSATHHAVVGTEPYGKNPDNNNYSHNNNAAQSSSATNDRPFSLALGA